MAKLGKLAKIYFGMWKSLKAESLFMSKIDDWTRFCYQCQSSKKELITCLNCKTTYCSDECRTNHLPVHKPFCLLPSSKSKLSFKFDSDNEEWSISNQNHAHYTFAYIPGGNDDEEIALFHSKTKEQFELPLVEGIYCAHSVNRRLWIPIKQKTLMPFLVDFYLRNESSDTVIE